MKLGTENKKMTWLAVALLVVAAIMVVRMFSMPGPGTPAASSAPGAQTVAGTPAPRTRDTRDTRNRHPGVVLAPTLDPRLRLDLAKQSETVAYAGTGRNIFREHLEEIPQPKAPALTGKGPQTPQQLGPPPPPPINLKFYGWASKPGEPKAVFLSQGESVFVAKEGDIIARRYKVVRISNSNVEIEDVLSNNRQSIPLTQG